MYRYSYALSLIVVFQRNKHVRRVGLPFYIFSAHQADLGGEKRVYSDTLIGHAVKDRKEPAVDVFAQNLQKNPLLGFCRQQKTYFYMKKCTLFKKKIL